MAQTSHGSIIVVSGLPRSGTSMMMRILDKGGLAILTDEIRIPDSDNPLGYYEYEPVKRLDRDASWLVLAINKAVKIIYVLLYALPADHQYRVLFMRRPLDEVAASQMRMRRRRPVSDCDLTEQQLIGFFQSQLQRLDAWLSLQAHMEVKYVEYHEVLADPAAAALEISRFLGLPLNTTAMVQAVDPSLCRNRSHGASANRGNQKAGIA